MSVFLLPRKITDQIDKVLRKFWWGEQEEKGSLHTTKWDGICKPTSEGGPGDKGDKIQ